MKMGLKDTIDNHPVRVFGGIAIMSLTAGIAVDKYHTETTYRAEKTNIVSTLALSSQLSRQRVSSARTFDESLQDTVWTFSCGAADVKWTFGFGRSGSIVKGGAWDGYTWATVAPRAVAMTSIEGDRVFFMFSSDMNSFKFISWQGEQCEARPAA